MALIETSRLSIRNFRPADAQDLQKLIIQYSASPYGIYDHQWPTSEMEILGITDWFASGDQYLAVCLKETGQFIGFISINKPENSEAHEYDFGYIFNADYHGKGYASESCRAVVRYAFGAWEAQRLVCGTAAVNEPSCRLLARLGFKKAGEGMVYFQSAPDGTPYEFLGYNFELTREEWAGAQLDRG
jgi:RimJ/RimL family protein N-acetyltransferase